jgi:hypothetical protein
MMYWYELVLIYFASGLALIGLHKLYPILPPKEWIGCVILSIACIGLIVAWWFILRPYETFEYLAAAQKDQLLYAIVFNFPVGHLLFSYLLGHKPF